MADNTQLPQMQSR